MINEPNQRRMKNWVYYNKYRAAGYITGGILFLIYVVANGGGPK